MITMGCSDGENIGAQNHSKLENVVLLPQIRNSYILKTFQVNHQERVRTPTKAQQIHHVLLVVSSKCCLLLCTEVQKRHPHFTKLCVVHTLQGQGEATT